MGIVIKQSIRGTFWSYVGVVIGFVTASYLYPNYFTTSQVGLIGLLLSYSQLLGRLSLLGLPGVTSRLFPYFRNSQNGHNGFLNIALIFHVLGLILFLVFYFSVKPIMVENNIQKSPLFVQYLYLLVPMTIATMIFAFFDTYNQVLYNATFGTFLQEFIQRILILIITIVYALKLISFNVFIITYVILFSVKTLIIFLYLLQKDEIRFKVNKGFINKSLRKEIKSVALFSLAGGLGSMIIFNFDKIIINELTDLANTGVYTIAIYIGSLISKPSQSLLKISNIIIADAWKKDDRDKLADIYFKSSLNQMIIGGFLFLGVWANIDNILIILGDSYLGAKWVIFFIGLGYLIDMSLGTNGQIIGLSKYYRVSLLFLAILIVVSIGLMYLLIPLIGIVGAAIAISLSLLLNNLMRMIFLYVKYRMHPFRYKHIIVIVFYMVLYFMLMFIPQQQVIFDIFIRGSIITIVAVFFFFKFRVSTDIQNMLGNLYERCRSLLFR